MLFALARTVGSTMQMEFVGFGWRRQASKHVAAPAATPSIPSLFDLLRALPLSLDLGLSQSSALRFLAAAAVFDIEGFIISELTARGRVEERLWQV